MTSEARIEANRRNARHSTGPKTEAGKERVRLNALKHGLAGKTVVLPHEDAAAFERRRDAWTRELSPGGDAGDYLAERAVRISWQLDRADAAEHAELSRRVREVPKERERSRRRRAAEQVRGIVESDPQESAGRPKRSRAERLERLESSAQGCRALLEAWAALEGELSATDGRAATSVGDRLVRLLGAADLVVAARSADPRLRRIADITDDARNRLYSAIVTHPNGPRPDDTDACLALLEFVAEERQRLLDLLEDHEAEEADLAAEDAARAGFDTSKDAEAVHRYQNQWGRALLQTFKAIASLHPSIAVEPSADEVEDQAEATSETTDTTEATAPAVAAEQSQSVDDNVNDDLDFCQLNEDRSECGPDAATSVGLPRRRSIRRRGVGRRLARAS